MFWTIFLIGMAYLTALIILVFIVTKLVDKWTTPHKDTRVIGSDILFKDGREAERIEAVGNELRQRTEGKAG